MTEQLVVHVGGRTYDEAKAEAVRLAQRLVRDGTVQVAETAHPGVYCWRMDGSECRNSLHPDGGVTGAFTFSYRLPAAKRHGQEP